MNLYQEAQKLIPAGVNSPVRAFRSVGGNPIFAKRGKGPYFWDESGKRYFDFCNSWGALLFGHAPDGLIKTISREIKNGTSFGIATKKEVDLAKALQKLYPSMEMMRLVSSGTEAVMSAVRLARGFTGRTKIVKIDGGYHGHVDSMLVKAGSGGATFGIPDSAGVPEGLARETLTVPFNDIETLERLFKKEGGKIALLALEPVPANMGVVLPKPGYLEACRKITKKYGSLLLFDEVITGFRLSAGGAQAHYKIKPDLTCLGKILGSGFPIAAFGGRKEIMEKLAPLGPVYQAGTLSGNPAAVSAALWVVNQLKVKSEKLKMIHQKADNFYAELYQIIKSNHYPVRLNKIGSMFTLFFTPEPVTDYASAKKSETKKFAKFFHFMLGHGVYMAPSQFEANFISGAQKPQELNRVLKVIQKGLQTVFSD